MTIAPHTPSVAWDPTSVRELRYRGDGVVELATTVPRALAPHEVRVAPLAVGVCGTDAHIVAGSFPAARDVVLGHEVAGRVVERGTEAGDAEVGDLVTVEPHKYCGRCTYCRAGKEHLCAEKRGYGVRLDGGMAQTMIVPERIAYRLPGGTTPWVGALCEPVSCCIHAMDRLQVVSGESLLVFGCGPAGAILVALARLLGAAPVVVMEPHAGRRELALRMGADHALDPSAPGATEQALALTGGTGFSAVIDAVGSGRVLESAIAMAARGGRVLEFGVAAPDDVATIRPNDIYTREITLLGSVINPYTHQRAVALLPRLGLERLTTAFFALEEFPDALDGQRRGVADKVFVAPHGAAAAQGAGAVAAR